MEKKKKKIALPQLVRLTFPKRPPYENTLNFLTSLAQDQRLHVRAVSGDESRQDPYIQRVLTNRVFEKTKQVLEEKREFAKVARTKLAKQWVELREKEDHFRETFSNMNAFVLSNHEKRIRAVARQEEERLIFLQRVKEIKKLRNMKEMTERAKMEMEEDMDALKLYEKYLNQVVSCGTEFKNANDILSRYETLLDTKTLLGEKQNRSMEELQMLRAKTAKMAEANNMVIIGLNTVLAGLRVRFTDVHRRAMHWEQIVFAIKNHMYINHKEICAVKQSCWNLYLLMAKRRDEAPKIGEGDPERQLTSIKKMLQVMSTMKQGDTFSTGTGVLKREKKK